MSSSRCSWRTGKVPLYKSGGAARRCFEASPEHRITPQVLTRRAPLPAEAHGFSVPSTTTSSRCQLRTNRCAGPPPPLFRRVQPVLAAKALRRRFLSHITLSWPLRRTRMPFQPRSPPPLPAGGRARESLSARQPRRTGVRGSAESRMLELRPFSLDLATPTPHDRRDLGTFRRTPQDLPAYAGSSPSRRCRRLRALLAAARPTNSAARPREPRSRVVSA